jgi:myo-inositol-1-phosphate synthase
MSKKIRIAVAGVGNCFSTLYQGLEFYKDHDEDASGGNIPGVMFSRIGGYHPADIQVVAAFDIDRRKVGRPIGEAIFAKPNCARVFCEDVPDGPIVMMGPVLDGYPKHMDDYPEHLAFRVSNEDPVDVTQVLKDQKVDILINYMPVGSQKATEHYAQACLNAGVSFLNCMPVFIASDPDWERKFIEAGIPLLGDDMKSMLGASILSQMFQELLFDRGCEVQYHGQYNQGSNTDFLTMEDKSRLASKKVSKENVIRAQNDLRGIPLEEGQLYAGPSVYVPKGDDEKVAFFDIRATGFGGFPIKIDARLSVCDSENSSGVTIDAIRYLKVAREMGIIGALRGPSAFTQKTPPQQMHFKDAKYECEMLAKRELTDITKRQLTQTDAVNYMEHQIGNGSTAHLERVKEYQRRLK